jgi:hypothetical protein
MMEVDLTQGWNCNMASSHASRPDRLMHATTSAHLVVAASRKPSILGQFMTRIFTRARFKRAATWKNTFSMKPDLQVVMSEDVGRMYKYV